MGNSCKMQGKKVFIFKISCPFLEIECSLVYSVILKTNMKNECGFNKFELGDFFHFSYFQFQSDCENHASVCCISSMNLNEQRDGQQDSEKKKRFELNLSRSQSFAAVETDVAQPALPPLQKRSKSITSALRQILQVNGLFRRQQITFPTTRYRTRAI